MTPPYRLDDPRPHAVAPPPMRTRAPDRVGGGGRARRALRRRPTSRSSSAPGSAPSAREIDVDAAIDYAEIPGFPLSTVESHAGRLLVRHARRQDASSRCRGGSTGTRATRSQQVTFPVRVMRALGARHARRLERLRRAASRYGPPAT